MVDCHGSQCGFCTPGFVMSLFALYKSNPRRPASRSWTRSPATSVAAPATGRSSRRPRRMYAEALPTAAPPIEPATIRALDAMQGDDLALTFGARRYFAPRSVGELAKPVSAIRRRTWSPARPTSGLWVTKQHRDLETADPGQRGRGAEAARGQAGSPVDRRRGHLQRCAGRDPAVAMPSFGELIRRIASPPIRNSGTLGGNIANGSPIGDSMPALIALGASSCCGAAQQRRELPLEDFYLGYRARCSGPASSSRRVASCRCAPTAPVASYKLAKRFDQDISACARRVLGEAGGRPGAATRGSPLAAWRRSRSGRPCASSAARPAVDARARSPGPARARAGFLAVSRHAGERRAIAC